ncbi:hypothetical protein AB0912_26900 [Streptomyces sp. NPDC007084]|uniref:hypothetical protein n=1 Tax=Streptomyces sp. NPDC007084 TaxID=3154313 RepID=UPI003451A7B1
MSAPTARTDPHEEGTVPHLSVRHWPREFTAEARNELVAELTSVITRVFEVEEGSVSISVEPVAIDRWHDDVHVPELVERAHLLWKRPHYSRPLPNEGSA